jgi:transposase
MACVAHDIVMTTDRGQLTLVAEQVQETLDTKDITIIADKGYFSRIDIKATQKKTCIFALRARNYPINVT